jgi:hypothetical protein
MWNEGDVRQFFKLFFADILNLNWNFYAHSTLQYPLTYCDNFVFSSPFSCLHCATAYRRRRLRPMLTCNKMMMMIIIIIAISSNSSSSSAEFFGCSDTGVGCSNRRGMYNCFFCYPCNRPWKPIGLWDVEAPTFSLDQCCPTFLCTRAQFTDAYGGAGATTLLLRLLNTAISTTSTTTTTKLNSMAWVHMRTIPTDWATAALSAKLVPTLADRGCRVVSATIPPQSLIFGFLEITRLSGPRFSSNPDLWICSQELWPLDHRGGHYYYYYYNNNNNNRKQ